MMNYQKFELKNGLQLYVHTDKTTEMAVLNMLYRVGSRNEIPGKTGLAHYFEHLMFGGSQYVSSFDTAVERVGGECNAFTNTDITNYYINLPAVNIETAYWLESDRMLSLNLQEKTIENQREVVIEEFKQRYLNQPYGDAMHHVRDLAFDKHSYQWPTIGKEIADIENFTAADVADFYQNHYVPNNAILVVAGNIEPTDALHLAEKWFGDIPARKISKDAPPTEPVQRTKKTRTVLSDVPTDALYKVYHIPGRLMPGYLEADLITDVLGFGRSSILEKRLVSNTDVFASCRAYVLGSIDPNLLIISAKMEKGHNAEDAEILMDQVIEEFKQSNISPKVLQKVKNQADAMKTYESVHLLNRAMKLAYYAHLGSPELYEEEYERKLKIKGEAIIQAARELMTDENSSVVYYKRKAAEVEDAV